MVRALTFKMVHISPFYTVVIVLLKMKIENCQVISPIKKGCQNGTLKWYGTGTAAKNSLESFIIVLKLHFIFNVKADR